MEECRRVNQSEKCESVPNPFYLINIEFRRVWPAVLVNFHSCRNALGWKLLKGDKIIRLSRASL